MSIHEALRRWTRGSLTLGLGLVLASILLPMQATFPLYKRGDLPLLLYSGVVMTLLAIAAWWRRDQVADWLDAVDIDNEPAAQRTYPYVTLFMISFVTLFVEIALTPIRNN